jgi:hypothetical protein
MGDVAPIDQLKMALASISNTTRIRFTPVVQGCGGCSLFIDDLQITYGGKTAIPLQIAPIFRDDFNTDPRWAVIPRVGSFSNPDATPIEGFWGFFGYGAYTNNNKVQAFDGWVFDPALMLNDPAVDSFFYGFSPEPVVRLVT